eukprot:scaffold10394_cov40-Phaeocystis_antarctica.AAC.3
MKPASTLPSASSTLPRSCKALITLPASRLVRALTRSLRSGLSTCFRATAFAASGSPSPRRATATPAAAATSAVPYGV